MSLFSARKLIDTNFIIDKMRPMVYELGFLKNKIKLLDNDERRELLFKSCPNMKKII